MKVEIKVKKEVEIKTLIVHAAVRYWEDSTVNGTPDTEEGDNMPCKVGDSWKPIIDVDSGVITNWKKGTTASLHYKVCDGCGWDLLDENGEIVLQEEDGYVPKTLSPKENGYGDYIIMDIDESGLIADWEFDVEHFIDETED
jgi:hypothetical protein